MEILNINRILRSGMRNNFQYCRNVYSVSSTINKGKSMIHVKLTALFISLFCIIVIGKSPDWVTSKPISSSSYVGIGVATKSQYKTKEEWIKAAESRALSNISEAISISIEGNSKLTQTATNTEIKDLYEENIRTFTKANLEGYQFVENWEDKKEFWIYYTLDKATWQAIEQKRLREAVAKSQAYINNAVQMQKEGALVSAIRGFTQAYAEIVPVLHLDPRISFGGSQIPVTAHIDNSLVGLLNSVTIDMKKPLYTGARSNFGTSEPKITVRTNSLPAASFPLLVDNKKRFTSNDGSLGIGSTYIPESSPATGDISITITTDLEQFMPTQSTNPLVSQWLSMQKWPSASAILRFTKPAIFIESASESYSDLPFEELENAMKSKITEIGYSIARYNDEADMRLVIKSSSRAGGSMGNLYFSFVDISWSLFKPSGDEIMAESLPSFKDGALSYDEATLKAYKKAGASVATRISTWIKENHK